MGSFNDRGRSSLNARPSYDGQQRVSASGRPINSAGPLQARMSASGRSPRQDRPGSAARVRACAHA